MLEILETELWNTMKLCKLHGQTAPGSSQHLVSSSSFLKEPPFCSDTHPTPTSLFVQGRAWAGSPPVLAASDFLRTSLQHDDETRTELAGGDPERQEWRRPLS